MSQNLKTTLETPLTENQGILATMLPYDDPRGGGDLKVIWDRTNPDEVESARKQFREMKAKGFMAYKVTGKDGKKGEVINEFDPDAQCVILAPPLRGGRS